MTILTIHVSNVYAIDFADHTGYTPSWAQSMGSYQALDKCNGIVGENSADGNWCMEWVASVIDQGPDSFNPQTPSYHNPSFTQNIPLTISKSNLIEFLPTSENVGSDYQISSAMGLNGSNPLQQTLNNLGIIDLVSKSFWKTGSNNTLAITTMITKFNSNDNASAVYDKKVAYARKQMDPRFSWTDNMSDIGTDCTGIITSINLEPNNPNNNSETDDWYCVKNNLVVYVHGKLDWRQSGESGPILPNDTSDFMRIIVNKIIEKFSKSNTSAIIPDEAKIITRSWVNGSISPEEFFRKIQSLLDSGQMVIPPPNPSNEFANFTKPDEVWDFILNKGLIRWAQDKSNDTSTIPLWQYCISVKYLTEKSWVNKSSTNQNSTIQNIQQSNLNTTSNDQTNQVRNASSSITPTISNNNNVKMDPASIAAGLFIILGLPAIIILVIVWKLRKYLAKRRNNKLETGT